MVVWDSVRLEGQLKCFFGWRVPHLSVRHMLGRERCDKIIQQTPPNAQYKDMLTEHITTQIEKLQDANMLVDGWRQILDDKDSDDVCTLYHITSICYKCTYLAMVLSLALQHYELVDNFRSIIQMDIDAVNKVHLANLISVRKRNKSNYVIHDTTAVFEWFREFRINDCFMNPAKGLKNRKLALPRLINDDPDILKSMINFCRENISNLTVECVHQFLLRDAIPKLAKTMQEEHPHRQAPTIESILKSYGLKTLSIKTVQSWMKRLGFKYEPRKKSYYLDLYETEENVTYRAKFIKKYFDYEFLAHRWYSVLESVRDEMVAEGKISSEIGYRYEKYGKVYYKFHVDDHPSFHDNCLHVPFGGYLLVRKPRHKQKIMMFGQDEAIMKQKLFTLFSWTLLDGAKPLMPKDKGQGVMVSAFTSRELGFGCDVTEDELANINEKRKDEHYSDPEAAEEFYGTSKKQILKSSPFIRELDYGKNNEGYWRYSHMVVQLEDVVDVL